VAGERVRGLTQVSGWVASSPRVDLDVELAIDGQPAEGTLIWVPRPDVLAAVPRLAGHNPTPGFVVSGVNFSSCTGGRHRLTVRVRAGRDLVQLGEVDVEVIPAAPFYKTVYTKPDPAKQQRKLDRLVDVLSSPCCRAPLDRLAGTHLGCRGCGVRYPIVAHVPIMVQGQPEYPIEEERLNSPPSNNPYPEMVTNVLLETLQKRGLVLDLGAGRRLFGAEGLIQLEICRYPFTDVVNQGERLPFRDEAFDLVLCLAVTEHVLRPWVLAGEIERVLRRGGSLVVDSAFLQPIHGYPSHFFNMTPRGLSSLFRQLDVTSLKPGAWQHPWFSLRWILSHLLEDLPVPQRGRLGNLTVTDFVRHLESACTGRPSPLDEVVLPQHRIEELAAGFTLIGRKRAA
jgi:uncharacterized protein YbaR (Trm112 family)